MINQHEDDLVAKGARALWKADCRVLGYALDSGNASSRWQCNLGKYHSDAGTALEASGIADLTRQLAEAREALELIAFNNWRDQTRAKTVARQALNPEQTK